jgi:hypothetical protein
VWRHRALGLALGMGIATSATQAGLWVPAPVTFALPPTGPQIGYVFTDEQGGHNSHGPITYTAGAEIFDLQGQPVWFWPMATGFASDVRVQTYGGQPVLTWTQGLNYDVSNPAATGFICDANYRLIATVRAGNGLGADLHEFQITPQGTALIDCYNPIVGPAGPGVTLIEGVIQEIDIPTGQVLFEWHSLQHVPITESVVQPSGATFDYFHINSIKVDTDNNLIVSARHTSTVYKINRTTGDVMWRLGGKNSSFALGPGLPTAYQHHAVPLSNGQIRIFDNESNGTVALGPTRVVWVLHNDNAMTATLVQSFQHPLAFSVAAEGSAQDLANGDTFVGWGDHGGFSEFDLNGRLVLDIQQSPGYASYRGYRFAWSGAPTTAPTLHVMPAADGTLAVDAIWNGATGVASWQVQVAQGSGSPAVLETVPWSGYDTAFSAPANCASIQVIALDSGGNPLASSATGVAPFLTPAVPVIAFQPLSQTVAAGDNVVLTVGAAQAQTDYRWLFNGYPMPDGNWSGTTVAGAGTPTLILTNVEAEMAGSYGCVATNVSGETQSAPAAVQVAASDNVGRLINLSTLARTGTGANLLNFGFVLGGGAPSTQDTVLVRASGPALASFNVASPLPDPQLSLYGGLNAGALLGTDAGWQGNSAIAAAAAPVGAFAWPNSTSLDSALLTTLGPGVYAAQIGGASGDTGMTLAEVYDTAGSESEADGSNRLINLSARASVTGTSSLLTAGFVVGGSTSRTVLIRASGPALAGYGIAGSLADPKLQVYSTSGASPVLVASNAGWQGDPVLAQYSQQAGAFSWSPTSADSAVLITLPPGDYTAQISSAKGQNSGIALAEVYEIR